ncbi:MAG: adenylate/guanylate cyclase domain-containing protein, partial [Candidatus Limnocylindria bacterium]
PVVLTYVVPYLVSTISSVAANRSRSAAADADHAAEDRAAELLSRVPGQNPNPVLRMQRDGRMVYANDSSQPLRDAFGAEIGDMIPHAFRTRFLTAADAGRDEAVEVAAGVRTFSVLPIAVPDADLVNLYGTDTTGAKVVERFPERNPNPVMRMSPDGTLLYSNQASAPVVRALGLRKGDPLPPDIREACLRSLRQADSPPFEVSGEGRTFAFKPVHIPEFDFVNLYGTDVTALKALDKFPDRNPNPVMRVSRDGLLTYANPASAPVRTALGVEVGKQLPAAFLADVQAAVDADSPQVLEVIADDRTFELLVVSLYEFDSINLYGTEVTAARAVAQANRENERLLLNILPPSIADRLRQGELVIADRFDEMTVMFVDCVRFTELSSSLTPPELVVVLNELFSIFDRLADQYGLEKIKTIGDAYMVVGGLTPERDGPSHIARVANMALDIMEEVKLFRTPLGHPVRVRIGIHTGPTVAGVIGLKKFIYDIWGDAVNMASRMESQGVPGRIQVSAPTYERLAEQFTFERRGTVSIKGKGALETYFLLGRRRPADVTGQAHSEIPQAGIGS